MHNYLRAIGYSRITSRAEAERLITRSLAQASERRVTALSDHMVLTEASCEYSDGIGITVRGELDTSASQQDGEALHIENYFPYYHGTNVSMHENVFISKRVDTEAYNGMCDDSRVGVSLIFYLQNAIDYLDSKKRGAEAVPHPVTLSALSLEGRILLPAASSPKEQQSINSHGRKRSKLISEAKKGNQDAIENLTMEDLDLYSMVCERAHTEDVYSIVDTTFIPYGAESDVYTVLGHIDSVRLLENKETQEQLYTMQISCNNMSFDLCINRCDLLGEPEVGRRFRGVVWMQGLVDFI